jgi:hypothetical protein
MRDALLAPIAERREAPDSIHQVQGAPIMIRISSLIIGLMLSSIIPTSGQESQPSQSPSQKAQSQAACRSKCEAQYTDYKECAGGVAPMHSACDLYNECVHDCE